VSANQSRDKAIHVAIVTASRHGGTHEVGEWMLSAMLQTFAPWIDPYVVRCELSSGLETADAVILGGPIYAGQWPRSGRNFVSRNSALLRRVPVMTFSCSIGGVCGQAALEHIAGTAFPVIEHHTLGGVIRLERLSLPERVLVKTMRTGDTDTRSRERIRQTAADFADHLLGVVRPR
jgi:menaquinone-dependent protoporphyrinogen IX oxidase